MNTILSIEGLSVNLTTRERSFDILSDLNLVLEKGEILALVGESGSGKSMTAMSIMRLLPEPMIAIVAGHIHFKGMDMVSTKENELRSIRGNRIGLIFQEPMTSLNPTMTVGLQVAEVLKIHKGMGKKEARERVVELFDLVRIPDPTRRFDDYPHQMSGGMRQRVVIALALACNPDILVADEPTTALDVTIQAQILDIFRQLQSKTGTAMILITHDLAVVAETADRVAVMYAGRIVEEAPSQRLFDAPRHPYTMGLLNSIPHIIAPQKEKSGRRLFEIPGTVPALWNLPAGCTFAPRCARVDARCWQSRPPFEEITQGHKVACWYPEEARS